MAKNITLSTIRRNNYDKSNFVMVFVINDEQHNNKNTNGGDDDNDNDEIKIIRIVKLNYIKAFCH